MADIIEPEVAAIGIRLLDDAYLAWAGAEAESARALRDWFDEAPRDDRAYYAYLAALDREESAAVDLQRLSALTGPCRDAFTDHDQQPDPA